MRQQGIYLDRSSWHTHVLSAGELPPGTWTRVPTLLMLAMAPVLGAALVVFLPAAGFVILAREGVSTLLRYVSTLSHKKARVAPGRILE